MDIQSYISSGVIEQYALGNLPKEEASILECVMKNNAEVAAAVFEAQKVLEELSLVQKVEPPVKLKSQIFAKLNFEKPLNETSTTESISTVEREIKPKKEISISRPKSNYGWSMAAASVVLMIGLGWSIYENNSKVDKIIALAKNNSELEDKLNKVQQQNEIIVNSQLIDLKGVESKPGMLASVYWDNSKNVYLSLKNLPQAPAGKQYQLWAIVDGKPVDAGVYDQNNPEKLQKMKSIENAQAFAITLENEGGSSTPTMDQMFVIGEI
ncbi:anti-sigma factor [Moheibacter sediminis]|uniref:Anti-sigma-K factor RskA n=1 Tax=Moheibacter sediminis TaxID=1434700 RepID=A0A1W1YE91_9FLAO|nr:anti-sigma factor [Moheibacter sediminis]SMC34088.1 Anti-sigma-K factor RskA [Moheibacter sediminis]